MVRPLDSERRRLGETTTVRPVLDELCYFASRLLLEAAVRTWFDEPGAGCFLLDRLLTLFKGRA